MLDRLPAPARHALITLLAALLAWATATLPELALPAFVAALVGPLLAMATAYVTPLTRQYGVGSSATDLDPGEIDGPGPDLTLVDE